MNARDLIYWYSSDSFLFFCTYSKENVSLFPVKKKKKKESLFVGGNCCFFNFCLSFFLSFSIILWLNMLRFYKSDLSHLTESFKAVILYKGIVIDVVFFFDFKKIILKIHF